MTKKKNQRQANGKGDCANPPFPQVDLHVVVSLPWLFPLIHLAQESGRSHLKCNCLWLFLLGSITEAVGRFLILLCLLQWDLK